MQKMKEIGKSDFDALLCIQREMLSENRRMRLLTIWLIGLTAVLLATAMITVVATI